MVSGKAVKSGKNGRREELERKDGRGEVFELGFSGILEVLGGVECRNQCGIPCVFEPYCSTQPVGGVSKAGAQGISIARAIRLVDCTLQV